MKNILLLLLVLSSWLAWTGCQPPPIYDDIPNISWNSFSKDTIPQFSGFVTFRVDFTDGDGDIGKSGNNDTTQHLIIIDSRRTPNDTLYYQIPTIAAQGIVSGISGTIEVDVSTLCCLDPNNPFILCQDVPATYEPVTFTVRIKDNAGRWSNEIQTTPLYLQCFQ